MLNFNTKTAVKVTKGQIWSVRYRKMMLPGVPFVWKISHLHQKQHSVGTMPLYYYLRINTSVVDKSLDYSCTIMCFRDRNLLESYKTVDI